MAATERAVRGALKTLMLAAVALPGMVPAARAQETSGLGVQGGHFEQSAYDLGGPRLGRKAVSSDHLFQQFGWRLAERWHLDADFQQDTWSGATPVGLAPYAFRQNGSDLSGISAASPYLQPGGTAFVDAQGRPFAYDDAFTFLGADDRLVNTMSAASPETRKQVGFSLTRDHARGSLRLGAGVSSEHDYLSRYGSAANRWDFDQKRSTLSASVSYTASRTRAVLDHDGQPYIYDTSLDRALIWGSNGFNRRGNGELVQQEAGVLRLDGSRRDVAAHVGMSRVLTRGTLLEFGVGHARASGYLGNPYKTTTFALLDTLQSPGPSGEWSVQPIALLEQRPRQRVQNALDLRVVQHVPGLDAALRLGYRFYSDDWDIRAHAVEAEWEQPLGHGLTVTPRLRYYNQTAARFYLPWALSRQPFLPQAQDGNGNPLYADIDHPDDGKVYYLDPDTGEAVDQFGNRYDPFTLNLVSKLLPVDRSILPAEYSSDSRLAAFGSWSGGVLVTQRLRPGLLAELSWEYYRRAADLGSSGSRGSFADFHHVLVNAALRLELGPGDASVAAGHAGHHGSTRVPHVEAPAGVSLAQPMRRGESMVAYRYQYASQAGAMRHGTHEASDAEVSAGNLAGDAGYITPRTMRMHMHMAELMYAPSDAVTLMLMPVMLDMNMSMRALEGAPTPPTFEQAMMADHMVDHPHTTGGIGDISAHAVFRLFADEQRALSLGLGLGFPAAQVGLRMTGMHHISGFLDYGMQLGSGTIDFLPSLTFVERRGRVQWGAQARGERRLEEQNASGYRWGDVFEATAWTQRPLSAGLAGSLRVLFRAQGAWRGAYNGDHLRLSPADLPANYGGRFVDFGIGASRELPMGLFPGTRLALEWMQPVVQDVEGYQLSRRGTLHVEWSRMF